MWHFAQFLPEGMVFRAIFTAKFGMTPSKAHLSLFTSDSFVLWTTVNKAKATVSSCAGNNLDRIVQIAPVTAVLLFLCAS